MSDNNKMREVPPITDETYKALMVALGMPKNRSLLSALQQIANHATQRAAWQAAQSVPVVGEPVAWAVPVATQTGQPDTKLSWTESGARIGVKVGESTPLYLKPTTSISAAELERLRRIEAVMIKVGKLRFDYVTLPIIREMIDAAIAAEGENE